LPSFQQVITQEMLGDMLVVDGFLQAFVERQAHPPTQPNLNHLAFFPACSLCFQGWRNLSNRSMDRCSSRLLALPNLCEVSWCAISGSPRAFLRERRPSCGSVAAAVSLLLCFKHLLAIISHQYHVMMVKSL
jgi:hypothetical protein